MAMTNVMCEMPHSCQKDEIIAWSPRVRDDSANRGSSNDTKQSVFYLVVCSTGTSFFLRDAGIDVDH